MLLWITCHGSASAAILGGFYWSRWGNWIGWWYKSRYLGKSVQKAVERIFKMEIINLKALMGFDAQEQTFYRPITSNRIRLQDWWAVKHFKSICLLPGGGWVGYKCRSFSSAAARLVFGLQPSDLGLSVSVFSGGGGGAARAGGLWAFKSTFCSSLPGGRRVGGAWRSVPQMCRTCRAGARGRRGGPGTVLAY